mgnify:CR=1 FL=1
MKKNNKKLFLTFIILASFLSFITINSNQFSSKLDPTTSIKTLKQKRTIASKLKIKKPALVATKKSPPLEEKTLWKKKYINNFKRVTKLDKVKNLKVELKRSFIKIKKRDGAIVDFDAKKITAAITKAGLASKEFDENVAKTLTIRVLQLMQQIQKPVPLLKKIF